MIRRITFSVLVLSTVLIGTAKAFEIPETSTIYNCLHILPNSGAHAQFGRAKKQSDCVALHTSVETGTKFVTRTVQTLSTSLTYYARSAQGQVVPIHHGPHHESPDCVVTTMPIPFGP